MISGNGPVIDAGGRVRFTSSGTPSQVSTRVVRLPWQYWTPLCSTQGMRPPKTELTTAARAVEASAMLPATTPTRKTNPRMAAEIRRSTLDRATWARRLDPCRRPPGVVRSDMADELAFLD